VSVTRAQIAAAIRSLGVGSGDLLLTHSSFKSLGPVEGGPRAVAEALVDAVTPGGSAFVPTFNYGRDPFDAAAAPSYDGVITEFFRKLPDAVRSDHPTHPLAGVGPDAAPILADHARAEPFGRGSPCWRLWQRNAWVLLIGVGHESNSMAHVAEEMLEMPYLDRRRTARIVRPNGAVESLTVRRPGCSDVWDSVLDPALRAWPTSYPRGDGRGAIIDGAIGSARVMLMRSSDVVETTANLLRRNPAALLCDRIGCDACAMAREMLHSAGGADPAPPG
jgi:aminoglycoside 3-N-acetyltransferase